MKKDKIIMSYSDCELHTRYLASKWGTIEESEYDKELFFYLMNEKCNYCNCQLEMTRNKMYKTGLCENCGWWKYVHTLEAESDQELNRIIVGIVKQFDFESIDVPIQDLRRYLRKNPKKVASINPQSFEKLICSCLRSYYQDAEVIHVGKSGDGGIDALLIHANSDIHLVQIKRRENLERNEGIQVVRELNGVLFREGLSKGIIVSTAKDFTKGAKVERNVRTQREKYSMKLLNFSNFVQMLNLDPVDSAQPWLNHLHKSTIW